MKGLGRGVTRRPGRRWWAAVLVVGVALSVTGCTKDGGSGFALPVAAASTGAARPASASTAPADATRARTPAPTPAAATVDPAGPVITGGRVTARRAGLSFEVPDGWQAIEPSSAANAGASVMPDSFRALAQQSGLTADEFLKRISRAMDVMVMGRPRRGFADNVSVIPTPTSQLPSPDEMRSQLETAGASVERVDRTTTPVGRAIVAKSRIPLATTLVASRSIAVELDGRITYITVSASDPDTADSIADGILRSLRRA